jgi:hypothetical protein
MAIGNRVLKKFKIIIDVIMIILLPMLMAYSLIGETFHEIIGTMIFILFIIHHVMNRKWYLALTKGKYNVYRIILTVLDSALVIVMLMQSVSGILLSKHLYTFLPVLPVTSKARVIHLMFSFWGFVLMSLHAGMHLAVPFKRLWKDNKKSGFIIIILMTMISMYGVYSFIKREFPGYMLMKNAFMFIDFNESRIHFFMDYMSVMILFIALGILINILLTKKKGGNKDV